MVLEVTKNTYCVEVVSTTDTASAMQTAYGDTAGKKGKGRPHELIRTQARSPV